MSIGEDRVRVTFNPSDNILVDEIKQMTARLINGIQEMRPPLEEPEKALEHARLKALAMTAYEEAAMWAVKAATI